MAVSAEYFVFVLSLLALFHLVKSSWRIYVLLTGSLAFYYWLEPTFFLVLILLCLSSWTTGMLMQKHPLRREVILKTFLAGLCLVYLPLKYSSLLSQASELFFTGKMWSWIYLPLGLSFYSFQVLSYVFDIYYEKIEPEPSFFKYMLYVSFFPQLICGPIERTKNITTQLESPASLKPDVRNSLIFIFTGFFKKKALADTLIFIIMPAFANPSQLSGLEWVLMGILTRLFIYYDFSGYTDLAIGVAGLFGIRLTNNFDRPFSARNIIDFWRRWHISLSNWIRDYIFYPLVSKLRQPHAIYLALVLSFLFLGLWHGDRLNFLFYGLFNGLAVALTTFLNKTKKQEATLLISSLKRAGFLVFILGLPSLLLISSDITEAAAIFSRLWISRGWLSLNFISSYHENYQLYYLVFLILVHQIFEFFGKGGFIPVLQRMKPRYQYMAMVFLLFLTFTFMEEDQKTGFLYQAF